MPDADLASTLAEFLERQALASDRGLGFARMGERHAALLEVTYEDAPILIKAITAALKAADDWDEQARKADARADAAGHLTRVSDQATVLSVRAQALEDCARELRAAITAALGGTAANA